MTEKEGFIKSVLESFKKTHKEINSTTKGLSLLVKEMAKIEQEAKRAPNKIRILEEKLNKFVFRLYCLTDSEFDIITKFIEEQ